MLDQIGELMIEQVLSYCADSKSAVDGSSFQMLSNDYAAKKKDETGSDSANLDLTGSMLNSLEFKVTGNKIEIGVFGEDAGKADGHNNFSGKSNLPERRFLPAEGQSFDSSIQDLIEQTIETYKADNIKLDRSELKDISTKAELDAYLKSEFEGLSMSRIRELILQSELSAVLDEYGLLDML